jgi:hypothetical protein
MYSVHNKEHIKERQSKTMETGPSEAVKGRTHKSDSVRREKYGGCKEKGKGRRRELGYGGQRRWIRWES